MAEHGVVIGYGPYPFERHPLVSGSGYGARTVAAKYLGYVLDN